MKNEIKETINWLNQVIKENKESDVSLNACVVPFETLYKLQDYITNLQQKYDKALTDLVHESHKRIELENKITNLQEENERLSVELNKNMIERNNYLSRNEKAIEYMNKHTTSFKDIFIPASESWYLLDILKGGDE